MTPQSKKETYQRLEKEILSVLDGETDQTAKMATVSCLLGQAFNNFFWTGFYVVDPTRKNELVIGPYQGTLGCLRIPFGKGVCGVAAEKKETQIVDDVHAFPGHIACDINSNSEIVVPVFDKANTLIAVFDVDSTAHGAFDEVDQTHLEGLMKKIFGRT